MYTPPSFKSLCRTVSLALTLCLVLASAGFAATRNITSADAAKLVATPMQDQIILDIRTPNEFAMGHIPLARNVDFFGPDFEEQLTKLDRGKPYIVYCRSGNRSASAVQMMEKMGFSNIYHMVDGFQQWRKAEYPVEH